MNRVKVLVRNNGRMNVLSIEMSIVDPTLTRWVVTLATAAAAVVVEHAVIAGAVLAAAAAAATRVEWEVVVVVVDETLEKNRAA